MSSKTLEKIISLFKKNNIHFRHLHHETIPKESAKASIIRGTTHEHGAKALILQVKKTQELIQVVLPAHKRTSLKKIRAILNEKNVSLASPKQVQEHTDCVVGSVPPMGVLWDIKVLIDPTLIDIPEIVFSAGTLEDSLFISPQDLVKVNNAQVSDILAQE